MEMSKTSKESSKDEMIQKIKEKLKKEEERKKIRQENLDPIKKHDMSK